MRKPVPVHLRALPAARNGRSARGARASVHALNGTPSRRAFPGLGILRAIRRAVGEVVAMAVILALSIVLAHAILIVMFPV